MKDEPVAYINVEERKLEWAKPITWHTPTIAQMDKVPLYAHLAKTLTDDAVRYQWLRNEYAHGRETYLAEGMPSGEKLDEYIDEQLKKAQEK
jgi:hypothetical protein